MKFVGEVEVVIVTLVAEKLSVDGEELLVVESVDVVAARSGAGFGEDDGIGHSGVYTWSVTVPLVEVRLAVCGRRTGPTGVDRFAVRPQGGIDNAVIYAEPVLEIGMTGMKIPDSPLQFDGCLGQGA